MFLLCVTASCHHTEKKQDEKSMFCKKDTVEILRLTNGYMEQLKNKNFDEAIRMLRHIEGDSVSSLNPDERKDLILQYNCFPVLSYKMETLILRGLCDTEVAFKVEFFEKQEGDKIPNTLKIRLNPQKIKDVWYLSVLSR